MKRFMYILSALALTMIFTGCSVKHNITFNDKYTPKANTKINVGNVANKTSETFELNIEQMTRDAFAKKLAKDNLLWLQDNNPKITLNVGILEYSEGNAFKRWLIPGWGATILIIEADLKEGNEIIGTGRATRNIGFGGAFTIGAWKDVYDDIATDLIGDFKKSYQEHEAKKSILAKADIVK